MTNQTDEKIDAFLKQPAFAVAGASTNREKFGNKVVRAYKQHGHTVYPINLKSPRVEDIDAFPDIMSIPKGDFALSIVTPPSVTISVVKAALERCVFHIWMQPGAENEEAVKVAEDAGASVIHGGPCVLVALGYRE